MSTLRANTPIWGNLLNRAQVTNTTNLNAAATWFAFGFIASQPRTLNNVRVFLNKTGTPAAADYRLEIYDNSSTGNPSSSLATATAPGSAPSSGVFVEWTGLSLALTENTQYWIVLKNLNATPASNFMTVTYLSASLVEPLSSIALQTWGDVSRFSTNSGSTWNFGAGSVSAYRLEFSDGSFQGLPLTTTQNLRDVHGTRESGVLFPAPDVDLVVAGIAMPCTRLGTPTGFPRYRIYQDLSASTRTLLGTTAALTYHPLGSGGAVAWYPLYFSSPVVINAGLETRVVLSETTQSDNSSNVFRHLARSTENDANTIALLGNFRGTLSTDGGSTFAETDTDVVPFALLLGPDGTGSGEGIVVPRRTGLPLTRFRRDHLPGILG